MLHFNDGYSAFLILYNREIIEENSMLLQIMSNFVWSKNKAMSTYICTHQDIYGLKSICKGRLAFMIGNPVDNIIGSVNCIF